MEKQFNDTPTEVASDEKLLAMLSHLSVLLGGILLPFIIWITQKGKSKFVRFHSLQAIFFQLSLAAIIIIFVIVIGIVLLISGIGINSFSESQISGGKEMPVFFIIMLVILYGGIFILAIGGVAYSIYLAIKSYEGKLIRIPVIGNILFKKVYERI